MQEDASGQRKRKETEIAMVIAVAGSVEGIHLSP